jgi:hypothetical protein
LTNALKNKDKSVLSVKAQRLVDVELSTLTTIIKQWNQEAYFAITAMLLLETFKIMKKY